MSWFLAAVAAQAAPVTGGDVFAERTVAAPAAQVYAAVSSLDALARFIDPACATEWSAVATGPDGLAATEVTWHLGLLHPRLSVVVDRSEAPRWIDYDHRGKRGFITRFTVEPVGEESARVSIHTFIDPPKWPLRRTYDTRVRPSWTACYVDSLERLAGLVAAGAAATP